MFLFLHSIDMVVFPNAKINLGLHIIGKRPDGYHNIETVFYPIPLRDALEIIPAPDSIFNFRTSGLKIQGKETNNLCNKAYQLLSKDFSLPQIHMHLHKVIPVGAGLGGGSSDGAFTIKLLNAIFDLRLSVGQMQDYARMLGSDCAFFIQNRPLYGYEKGDRFEPVSLDLSGYYIAVIVPDIHISTMDAYTSILPSIPDISITEIIKEPIEKWRFLLTNDFEPSVFHKHLVVRKIRDQLYDCGAVFSGMSGTGSAVYGIFKELPALEGRFPGCYIFPDPG